MVKEHLPWCVGLPRASSAIVDYDELEREGGEPLVWN